MSNLTLTASNVSAFALCNEQLNAAKAATQAAAAFMVAGLVPALRDNRLFFAKVTEGDTVKTYPFTLWQYRFPVIQADGTESKLIQSARLTAVTDWMGFDTSAIKSAFNRNLPLAMLIAMTAAQGGNARVEYTEDMVPVVRGIPVLAAFNMHDEDGTLNKAGREALERIVSDASEDGVTLTQDDAMARLERATVSLTGGKSKYGVTPTVSQFAEKAKDMAVNAGFMPPPKARKASTTEAKPETLDKGLAFLISVMTQQVEGEEADYAFNPAQIEQLDKLSGLIDAFFRADAQV